MMYRFDALKFHLTSQKSWQADSTINTATEYTNQSKKKLGRPTQPDFRSYHKAVLRVWYCIKIVSDEWEKRVQK